jgi:hypothetical protein
VENYGSTHGKYTQDPYKFHLRLHGKNDGFDFHAMLLLFIRLEYYHRN